VAVIKRAHLAMGAALALTALPLSAAPQDTRPRDDIAPLSVDQDDRAMNAARAEARRTLPGFLKLLADPPEGTGNYAIKYPLEGWEHIWVSELEIEGTAIVGKLANYPEQEGYEIGQSVRVPIAQVTDWGYRDAKGVMQGHFTTRVLLTRIDPADAAQIREDMGWSD
jgi:uncharacterized protein YegJ (DUF2314 family)